MEARIAGLLFFAEVKGSYNIHLLHQEAGVSVAGDALLEPVIEMQVVAFDNALKTIVGYHPRVFLFELAESKVVSGKKRQAVIFRQLAGELLGTIGLIFGIGAAQDLVDQYERGFAGPKPEDDPLQLFQLGHEVGSLLLQRIADPQ